MLSGEKYDNKVDVYSFGVLVYEVWSEIAAYSDFNSLQSKHLRSTLFLHVIIYLFIFILTFVMCVGIPDLIINGKVKIIILISTHNMN